MGCKLHPFFIKTFSIPLSLLSEPVPVRSHRFLRLESPSLKLAWALHYSKFCFEITYSCRHSTRRIGISSHASGFSPENFWVVAGVEEPGSHYPYWLTSSPSSELEGVDGFYFEVIVAMPSADAAIFFVGDFKDHIKR